MSDCIPSEVITNILHRLRVNDLVKFRLVSKEWMSIIDSPRFISDQLHRSQATNSNVALFLQTSNNLFYWRQKNGSSSSSSPLAPMEYLNQPSKVLIMGCCHGLICYLHLNQPHYDLVVLNPSTGERHTVSSFISYAKFAKFERYGFGYDELSRDYKVVMLSLSRISHVEIYDMRGKGFSMRIRNPSSEFICGPEEQRGVYVGGALHWSIVSYDEIGHSYDIIAFDLGSNTKRKLPHPYYDFDWANLIHVSIGIVDSCLSVCSFYKEQRVNKVGMYVMREYGNGGSWNKIYSFQSPSVIFSSINPKSVIPVGSDGDRVLLKVAIGEFVWLDNVDEAVLINRGKLFNAVYCLESLVKIFPVRDDEYCEEVERKEYEKKLAEQEKTWSNYCPCIPDLYPYVITDADVFHIWSFGVI
ncbi:F-box protein CPR1 [Linum perenne]